MPEIAAEDRRREAQDTYPRQGLDRNWLIALASGHRVMLLLYRSISQSCPQAVPQEWLMRLRMLYMQLLKLYFPELMWNAFGRITLSRNCLRLFRKALLRKVILMKVFCAHSQRVSTWGKWTMMQLFPGLKSQCRL